MATAPRVNTFNALNGELATREPSAFMQALSEADNFVRDLDRVRELETRNQELEAQVRDLTEQLDAQRALTKQWYETALSAIPHVEGDL